METETPTISSEAPDILAESAHERIGVVFRRQKQEPDVLTVNNNRQGLL